MARITRRDVGETNFDVPTGQLHKFSLREMRGHALEAGAVHFHLDSAVLLPNGESADDEAGGLSVLRAVYQHAKQSPAQKILIAGHTDTSGPTDYNQELSFLRAKSVMHALL